MEACAYVCCKWRHSRHQAAEVAEVIVHDLTENIRLKNASAATQWPAMTLAYSRQGFELLTSLFFELLAANARWAATAEDTVHGKAFARHMLRVGWPAGAAQRSTGKRQARSRWKNRPSRASPASGWLANESLRPCRR